jgi:hypothetical protein
VSEEFLRLMIAARAEINADILVDTNVMLEIDSINDLLVAMDNSGSVEAFMASPSYRYRQLRARYSILVAWWLSKTGTPACIHGNEVVDMMTGHAARDMTGDLDGLLGGVIGRQNHSYAYTTAVVHVVRPYVLTGLRVGAIIDFNHEAAHTAADDEIVRVAARDTLIVITNEGNGQNGVSDTNARGRLNLRGKCRAAQVPVFTPQEFLVSRRENIDRARYEFLKAAEHGILLATIDNVLRSPGGRAAVEHLYPHYRWVMLNEVTEDLEHLNRYPTGS